MAAPLPKAALYYSPQSIWASVPLLALEEKGYGSDEVDLKAVDIAKGENFAPSYLRLNPSGKSCTVPTLVVPLEKTLSPEIESRYKAIQDTKSIVEFLDKSRSAQSRTHTTSSAPSPSLTAATIAFATTSSLIIQLLHSPETDPNALYYMNARSDEELKALAQQLTPFLAGRHDALATLIADSNSDAIIVSEKTKAFWKVKKLATDKFIQVFEVADKPASELSEEAKKWRADYLQSAREAWNTLKDGLTTLNTEIIGPFALGDQLSIADLHLAAWLARIAFLAGATTSDDGGTVLAKIETHLGDDFTLPKDFSVAEARRKAGLVSADVETSEKQSKLAAFWDAMKDRASWKKVYGDGLH
ncbi:uncharacterized protein BXZ73DRAFT_39396 [Epithele typhae]|uniref:uncharacterized protein n=1 Tax=Epithele typhae TaxID=378194 RepID=UPI00200858BB|nr:uncharacterized protein BXZ73DRAFT_39396 [Epithele typhae]KAH9944341.1 hypothetical protein BXZ73DRAFT_39396 [Epithele typhae]